MLATSPALYLSGYVKLDIKNIPDYDTWIAYKSHDEETQQVKFDFEKSVTEQGKSLVAGIHYQLPDYNIYSTFVTDKYDRNDPDFFKPSGVLWYDQEKKSIL